MRLLGRSFGLWKGHPFLLAQLQVNQAFAQRCRSALSCRAALSHLGWHWGMVGVPPGRGVPGHNFDSMEDGLVAKIAAVHRNGILQLFASEYDLDLILSRIGAVKLI